MQYLSLQEGHFCFLIDESCAGVCRMQFLCRKKIVRILGKVLRDTLQSII